jgi:hypothetical protein
VREELVAFGGDRVAAGRGYIAVADSLIAALEGHWSEARTAMLEAEALLDGVGEGLMVNRFRLAIGHLAEGRFPEADAAGRKAEDWFGALGASEYLRAWRANAARPAAISSGQPPRPVADGAAGAEPEPSTAVRSGG